MVDRTFEDTDSALVHQALEDGYTWLAGPGGEPRRAHEERSLEEVRSLRDRLIAEHGERWGDRYAPVTLTLTEQRVVAIAVGAAVRFYEAMAAEYARGGDDRKGMFEQVRDTMRAFDDDISPF